MSVAIFRNQSTHEKLRKPRTSHGLENSLKLAFSRPCNKGAADIRQATKNTADRLWGAQIIAAADSSRELVEAAANTFLVLFFKTYDQTSRFMPNPPAVSAVESQPFRAAGLPNSVQQAKRPFPAFNTIHESIDEDDKVNFDRRFLFLA